MLGWDTSSLHDTQEVHDCIASYPCWLFSDEPQWHILSTWDGGGGGGGTVASNSPSHIMPRIQVHVM